MNIQEKLEIIQNQFGLQIEELEPLVYKVLNPDKEVNIDDLMIALEKVTLFYSTNYKTIEECGIRSTIASVYCIILDYKNTGLNYEYKGMFMNSVTEDYIKGRKLEEDIISVFDHEIEKNIR